VPTTVLIVDDTPDVRSVLKTELRDLTRQRPLEIVEASDGEEGWRTFCDARPDLVISDLHMPLKNGIDLLRCIRESTQTPVLLMSAHADVPTAVVALKGGAHDFLRFPEDVDRLPLLVESLLATHRPDLEATVEAMIVGRSQAMQRVRRQVAGVTSLVDAPVLVCGEPGTGRDHVVDVIHRLSPLAELPLVRVDCARSRPEIKPGARALYLDHLPSLSEDDQRMLHASIKGGSLEGVKLYASSPNDPQSSIVSGSLVRELAAHFNRFAIRLPSLRERAQDVPLLATALCERFGEEMGRPEARLTAAGLTRLKQYPWPGNVAELASVCEKLVGFSVDGVVTKQHVVELLGEVGITVMGARQQKERDQRDELVRLLEETGGNLAEIGRRLELRPSTVAYRARKYGLFPRDWRG